MSKETVLVRAQHPRVVFVPPVLLFASGLWLQESGTQESLGVAMTVAGLLWLGSRLVIAKTNSLHLTAERAVARTGLVSASSIDFPLSSIESIEVQRGPFGRLLGYGSVSLRGHGGSRTRVSLLRNPEEFRSRAARVIAGNLSPEELKAISSDSLWVGSPTAAIRLRNAVLEVGLTAFVTLASIMFGLGIAGRALSMPLTINTESGYERAVYMFMQWPARAVLLLVAAFLVTAPIGYARDKLRRMNGR